MKWLGRRAMPNLPFLCLCLSQADFDKACKDLKQPSVPWLTPGFNGRTHLFENEHRDLACAICINTKVKGSTYESIAALIVHEAVHVWQRYCNEILSERNPSSELEAYVIQNITQTLLEAFRKQYYGPHT